MFLVASKMHTCHQQKRAKHEELWLSLYKAHLIARNGSYNCGRMTWTVKRCVSFSKWCSSGCHHLLGERYSQVIWLCNFIVVHFLLGVAKTQVSSCMIKAKICLLSIELLQLQWLITYNESINSFFCWRHIYESHPMVLPVNSAK